MRIAIASDHRGFKHKEALKSHLAKEDYEVLDFGPKVEEKVDYPEQAFLVTKKVVDLEADLGILICGTGIGMSIASNKVKGARCAKIDDIREAVLARTHNNANIVAFSSQLSLAKMTKLIDMFLASNYSYDERHNRRLAEIEKIENER